MVDEPNTRNQLSRTLPTHLSSLFEHDLGVTSWLWTQISLPYRDPGDDLPRWERRHGSITLTIHPAKLPSGEYGFPYGLHARQILLFLTTEAAKTQSREIEIGCSFSEFLEKIGIQNRSEQRRTGKRVVGGAQYRRAQDQLLRVLFCGMRIEDRRQVGEQTRITGELFSVAKTYDLWLPNKTNPNQAPLFGSMVTLSESFFNSLVNHPVPVDLNAIKYLSAKGSAGAIDVFIWLCYRMYLARKYCKSEEITWEKLKEKFGPEYSRERDFKKKFLGYVKRALEVYPEARVTATETGLRLQPSPPYIPEKS